jgi:hypothetical protein
MNALSRENKLTRIQNEELTKLISELNQQHFDYDKNLKSRETSIIDLSQTLEKLHRFSKPRISSAYFPIHLPQPKPFLPYGTTDYDIQRLSAPQILKFFTSNPKLIPSKFCQLPYSLKLKS